MYVIKKKKLYALFANISETVVPGMPEGLNLLLRGLNAVFIEKMFTMRTILRLINSLFKELLYVLLTILLLVLTSDHGASSTTLVTVF